MKKWFIMLAIAGTVYACGSNSTPPASEEKKPASGDMVQNQKGLELIGASDCTTCHKISEKNIGPAYTDVAKKYDNTEANIDYLVKKIIEGGEGVWGAVPMTPHPDVSEADAKEMVKYIMSLKK